MLVLTDNENVHDTCGELSTRCILKVDDIEGSHLLLDLLDDTDTADVTTSCDHGDVADLELDDGLDFACLDVELESIVDADGWVNIGDCAAIVCDDVWDTLGANCELVDAEELEGSFLSFDLVDAETALAVVDDTEKLVGLAELDDIHQTSWVAVVCADLAIDLNEAALDNTDGFLGVEGVLEAVAKEDVDWEALAKLVWTCGWVGSELTSGLSEEPVVWGCEALKMEALATWHLKKGPTTLFCFCFFI